ncbi:hypothetical protein D3C76_1714730 [compost metagenome]
MGCQAARTTGNPEAFYIPRLTHLRVVQDPAARSLQQISGIDQFIDHPQLQGLGRLQAGALSQQGQGFFDTDQTR